MAISIRYQPADSLTSPRFTGVRTFMRLPHITVTEGVDVAFVGLPFDTGASFKIGARFGPEAVRSASVLLRPFHPELNLEIFDHVSAIDFGDAPVAPGFIEDSYDRMASFLRPLHEAGVLPIAIGGDHSIVLPELPSNCCWGRGFRGLYITARTSVYYVRTAVPGTRTF